jgi:hypothetical protein
MTRARLNLGELGAFVRLYVRPKSLTRERPSHLGDVEVETIRVDDEGRSRKSTDLHGRSVIGRLPLLSRIHLIHRI